MRSLDIAISSSSFSSQVLFSGNDIPVRCFIGFQTPSQQRGQYKNSFFKFKSTFDSQSDSLRTRQHISDMTPATTRPIGRSTIGFRRRLLNFLRHALGENVEQQLREEDFEVRFPPGFHNYSQMPITGANPGFSTTDDESFVKTCVLTLNGKPLHSLSTVEASKEYGSPESYHLFTLCNGMNLTGFSNGISFEDYSKIYRLWAYDLGTSGSSYDENYTSAVRYGFYRLNVEFSCNLPVPLQCVIFAEYDSIIELDKFGKLSRSYVV